MSNSLDSTSVAPDAVPDTVPDAVSDATDAPAKGAKKTVLYLNHSAQMSGAEASLRALLKGLRQVDAPFEPFVALPGDGPFATELREENWNVSFAPLRRLQRPRGIIDGMASLLHVLQTAPHICRLVDKSGAALIHSNSTTAHLVGGVAAERTNRPSIWHCRDLISLERIAPQLASKATRVVAISACVASQLEKDGVPHEKITVIYNGLDPEQWRCKSDSRLRETLGVPADTFIFGIVGQMVPWKNHVDFIEAAAKVVQQEGMEHARFVSIGGDLFGEHKDYIVELRKLVKKHDLIERFNFIPRQSDAVDAISALDCLVHPASDEPFGRVLMEAMALEIPVIGVNENGPLEIVTHGHDGLLVKPNAPDELAESMTRIFRDAELREQLGKNGRETVIEKFHIADHAAHFEALYREFTD